MNIQSFIANDEFEARRQARLAKLQPNSIAIIPAAQLVTRSRDTEYSFRQDSYFWYLTGFGEPQACLVLSNASDAFSSAIFVLPKNKQQEIWHGRRLGLEQAPAFLSIDQAFSIEEINALLPSMLDQHQHLYFTLESYAHADLIVRDAIRVCKTAPKNAMRAPACIHDLNQILDGMRLQKSATEISIMRRAAEISAQAHIRAMRYAQSGKWEYQLEAEILHEFASNGARHAAYNTIVGSGENACILHYTENSEQLKEGDLVLIDAGCELLGYAADITRTFPVSGQFSPAQKAIYQLVLDAQSASLQSLGPGKTLQEAMNAAVRVIANGLIELHLLSGPLDKVLADEAWRQFFMHGIGHYLGLDVHDVGIYKRNKQDEPLQVGTVITIEPGIYISPDLEVDEQFKGIGVRIEDNILITSNGIENLTSSAPKLIHEIEALMQGKTYKQTA